MRHRSPRPDVRRETQRIGLARTFAHAGRVIVLDDVAASLDTVTEHHISQVLAGALADRTRWSSPTGPPPPRGRTRWCGWTGGVRAIGSTRSCGGT